MAFTSQLLFEAMPLPVFHKDVAGRYTGCNSAFARFIGKTPEAIIGRTAFDLSPQLLAGVITDKDQELLSGSNGAQTYESQIAHADGSLRDVIIHKARITDPAGTPVGIIGVITDITQHRRAEIALAESEQRFRALFEGAPDATILADPSTGLILDANATACRLLGRTRDELIGRHQTELHPPVAGAMSKETFSRHVNQAAHEGATHPIENELLRADGTTVPVEVLAQLIQVQGRPALVGTFRDITERKHAQGRIRHLEGMISICMYCKKIRTETYAWQQLERYITDHSDAVFSHGMCPDCATEQLKKVRDST